MKQFYPRWSFIAPFLLVFGAILTSGCAGAGSGSGGGGSGQLATNPASFNFGDVTVGTSKTQMFDLTNTGTVSVTVIRADVSGGGFSIANLALPQILGPGQSRSFSVRFAPPSVGTASGSVSLVSDASNSPTTVSLSGNGVQASAGQLTASPTNINFGDVAVGSSSTQTVNLLNSGNASLTISQANVTGPGFSISGLTLPLTLAPAQTSSFSVRFAPQAPGSVTGSVSLVSNTLNSPTGISLSGNGVGATARPVSLAWDPSTSVVVGYNAYRGGQAGGPYTKLNSSPIAGTTYTDNTVQAGQTYFYVATAVDLRGIESVFSNEAMAVIP